MAHNRTDAGCGARTTPGAAPGRFRVPTQRRVPLDRPRDPLPTRVADLPLLPPGYASAVDEGLRALRIDLAPGARAAIDDHVRFLLAWTAAINLTAIRDPVDVARLHVVDSLAALPLLRARGSTGLLDIGSGPGTVSLFKQKELIKRNIPTAEALEDLIKLIKENGDWVDP